MVQVEIYCLEEKVKSMGGDEAVKKASRVVLTSPDLHTGFGAAPAACLRTIC